MKSNQYIRARLAVIEHLITTVEADRSDKNNDRVVLRNGVFPDGFNEKELVNKKLKEKSFSDSELTFEELTKFNTWFNVYPEKVAGIEHITTSREFPISIKGTKEDIIRTVSVNKANPSTPLRTGSKAKEIEFELKLKMKMAKAKLKILSL